MTSDLYIVRHGNTFGPGETVLRVGARTDLPLSASGEAQAEALGRHFRDAGVKFKTARTGPLIRTRLTAERIGAYQLNALSLQFEPFLREIDYGPDEGVSEARVLERLGSEALREWEEEGRVPPGWLVEPERLEDAWRSLFETLRGTGGAHLVVTSNGVARFARSACGDKGPGKLSTGAFGIIRLYSDSTALLDWNVRPDRA
jgi:probable phosphoglycerate mutase